MIKNIKPLQDRSILKDPILDDTPPKQNWTVKQIGKIQLVRNNNPVQQSNNQRKHENYGDYEDDEVEDGDFEQQEDQDQDQEQEQESEYDEDSDQNYDDEYKGQYEDVDQEQSPEDDYPQQHEQSNEQFVQSQQTQREVEYVEIKEDQDLSDVEDDEYEDNEEGEYEEEDDGLEILPPIKFANQKNTKYNQSQYDDNQYDDNDDDDYIEQRATQSKSKPILSNAAFRMLNFEIRKEKPDLPRNIVKRTLRDEQGRRVDEYPVNKVAPVQQQQEQPRKVILGASPQKADPTKLLEQSKIQILINKIKNKIHNNSNNSNSNSNNYIFETHTYKEWFGFNFTDQMATNSDIINARNLRSYSEIFEVNKNFEFDETLLIKPFIRSNQGKQDQEFRSANGLAKSMQRLIQIVVDQNRILKDGSYVTYDQIYEYVHDRIRAMLTEMTQVYARNQYEVTYFRIPLLEGIIRFYLYSYYQVLLQNTELTLGNIVQIKKSLSKNIATVCQDYVDLFPRIDCDDPIFKNVPEFVQYQYLLHYLEVKTSVAHIVELGILLNDECPFFTKLQETNEFKFLKFVQEFIITKNLFGLVQLQIKEKLSFYQSFFIYLIFESLQGFQSDCRNKYLLNKNSKNFYPSLDEVFIALEYYEPDLKTYELLTGNYEQKQQQNQQQQQQQYQYQYQQQSSQFIQKNQHQQYDQQLKQGVQNKLKVVKENILRKFLELSQNMLKQKRFQEIALLKDRLEEFMGNNYYKNRIFKHWRLSILKSKNQKYYERLLHQPQSQLIEQPTLLQSQEVFLNHLAFTIGNYYNKKIEIIYKIVIIYDEFNNFNYLQNTLFQSLFQEKLEKNLQFDLKYSLDGEERILHLVIVCSTEFIQQEMCGTDLIISINKEDNNYQQIPTLRIQFDAVIQKQENHKYLQYEDVEMFENIFESIKFRNRINKLIDISLKFKVILPPVKAVSLVSVLSGIKTIQQNQYTNNSVNSFIYYCNLGQEYLQQISKANIFNVSQLPQELYFTRYLVDQQANQYVQKFNLIIKLMIPFLNQLHQPYYNSNHLIQVINSYLNQFNDHFTYYDIFQKQFEFHKSSLSGDWEMLFKQIIDDLIVYVEDSDQHFIVPLEFEFEIDHYKLEQQVEKDIKQLTYSEKGQISDNEIKNAQLDLFHTELVDWIRKKRKCFE